MPRCRSSRIFRLALALAMTLAVLLTPAAQTASHNPAALAHAAAERHAVLAAWPADHGHAHHDGWPAERHAGHTHGHDPADHSHDIPAPVASASGPGPLPAAAWRAPALRSHDDRLSFGIDRPPRV